MKGTRPFLINPYNSYRVGFSAPSCAFDYYCYFEHNSSANADNEKSDQ